MKNHSIFVASALVLSSLLASPVMAMEASSTSVLTSVSGRTVVSCHQEAVRVHKAARQEAVAMWQAEHKKLWDERKSIVSSQESVMKEARETRVRSLKACVDQTGSELTTCKKAAWDIYYQAQKDSVAKRMEALKSFAVKNEALWAKRVEMVKAAWAKHQETVKACQMQKSQ